MLTPTALLWLFCDMPHVSLAEAWRLPASPGVYVVYRHEAVLYVGRTQNLKHRWQNHHRVAQCLSYGPDVAIAWHVVDQRDPYTLDDYERAFIDFMQPRFNGQRMQPTLRLKSEQTSLVQVERERAGLTLSELARRTGMYLSALSKIEHGTRKLYVDEVARLAQAIGCKPSALIPELPEPEPIAVEGD